MGTTYGYWQAGLLQKPKAASLIVPAQEWPLSKGGSDSVVLLNLLLVPRFSATYFETDNKNYVNSYSVDF